jgi:hypothetical protein
MTQKEMQAAAQELQAGIYRGVLHVWYTYIMRNAYMLATSTADTNAEARQLRVLQEQFTIDEQSAGDGYGRAIESLRASRWSRKLCKVWMDDIKTRLDARFNSVLEARGPYAGFALVDAIELRLKQELEAIRSDASFWGEWVDCFPWSSYDPIADTPIDQRSLTPILAAMVRDMITGEDVPEDEAYRTHDGGFIGHNTYSEGLMGCRNTYELCDYSSSRLVSSNRTVLFPTREMVPVFNSSNKIEYKAVHKSVADAHFQLNPANGRYYNFDYREYPYLVIGHGFTNKDGLRDLGAKWEDAYGAYTRGSFKVLNKSNDVLNFFDGFKAMPYEEVVRGSFSARDVGSDENTLFMGVELECEMSKHSDISREEAARRATLAMNKHAITCEDGSLREGFEIISVPATLAYHYTMWEGLLRGDLRKQLVSFNSSRCGIHVHMSKESFTTLGLGKFMTFINNPSNAEFIQTVAQRTANTYCPLNATKITRAKDRSVFRDASGSAHSKYSAVNLSKKHTVEVRIFKGTLHYPSVMKNLEFLHALHTYVHGFASASNLGYEAFVSWLVNPKLGNRKAYPNLFNYLKGRDYIDEKMPTVDILEARDVSDDGAQQVLPSDRISRVTADGQMALRRRVASRSKTLNQHRALMKG